MQWWQEAVVYTVYVRSFADSDGDGVGDLEGVRSRLGYLELLGVDALCLSPVFPSPMVDHGFDVADPRAIDPLFGDLDAFDRLVDDAHTHGLQVLLDLVPRYTSAAHPWFTTALAAAEDSPLRERYVFRPGTGEEGGEPPNNWRSLFGGPAWTRAGDGQWYLHLLGPDQPDLDWSHPDVWTDLAETMEFWLERGVDGFRFDSIDGLHLPPGLPDAPHAPGRAGAGPPSSDDPRFTDGGDDNSSDNDSDNDSGDSSSAAARAHGPARQVRAFLDELDEVLSIGELRTQVPARLARFARPEEMHLAVDLRLARTPFDAGAIRTVVEETLAVLRAVDGHPAWMLAHHDTGHQVSRYGGGTRGRERARAMVLVLLALPGAVLLYHGDELGLPDVNLPDDVLQDPIWTLSGHTDRGRDAARVPIPWEGGAPGYGFTTGVPWLPMPESFGELTVDSQLDDVDSMLSLVRRALELRRGHPGFVGGDHLEWFGAPEGCLAFRRSASTLVCALNTSGFPVPLPPGDILLASGPLDGDLLPPDTAVWLA